MQKKKKKNKNRKRAHSGHLRCFSEKDSMQNMKIITSTFVIAGEKIPFSWCPKIS
jgi:hypothetical protein